MTATAVPALTARSASRRREHVFYLGMALAVILVVFAGFARTYYLRPWFTADALRPLLHLHGVVFTAWVVLLLGQVTLVAGGRVGVHRRLGVAGMALASVLVLVGATTAIIRAKEGFAPPGGPPPLVFLIIPFADMVVFAALVGAGFAFRRRGDTHKRLMVLATISLLAAPIARLPFGVMEAGPPAFFGLTDLFLVPMLVFDLVTRGRIHPATGWGALAIVASQPLRLILGGTSAWLAFAGWMARG
ncbi:MAG TPA: hypothetical protein VHG35_16465 [Gemmatimonadales bacterium]|nr:hypothetical protein [Gemmatimonadales bacterium]